MIFAGAKITSPNDPLKKVALDYLYNSLKNPKPEMDSKLRQLQIVKNLDAKQYSFLKRQLPYVVCANFNPPFRRTENFAFAEYFIVDLDHLSEKGLEINELRKKLESDERVMLLFLSPSNDGLKILFKLKERCYDSGLYSLFYKSFVRQLAIEMGLEQVVDTRTSDVCRACFISMDPDCYYNPKPVTIDWNSYYDVENSVEMFKMKHELAQLDKAQNKIEKQQQKDLSKDPDADAMQRIKEALNPMVKLLKDKKNEVYVPEQLNDILGDLKNYIETTGVQLYEVTNIQYGKKMKMKLGMRLAEINLFYGKRGFNVVLSPRSGTNAEFNEMMLDLVEGYIATNC